MAMGVSLSVGLPAFGLAAAWAVGDL